MIEVSVQVNVPWLPPQKKRIVLEEGRKVMDMLKNLGLNEGQAGSFLVVVNGRNRLLEDSLDHGDSVVVLPVLCGG